MKNSRWLAVCSLVLALPVLASEPVKPATPPAGGEKGAKPGVAAAMAAEVGKPAPEFTLKDSDGKEHKLSSYKGKTVVLEWINHECPVCKRHYTAKTMTTAFNSLKDKNVIWLAIDSSNFADAKADSIKKWWKDQGNSFPYLMDAAGTVGKSFGAKTTPHMFVIDPKGVLAYAGAIDDDETGDKGAKAKNYVVEAVNAIQKGTAVATATTKSYGCSVKYKD